MARVNIEERFFGEARLRRFQKRLGWNRREAVGLFSLLWFESQEALRTSGTAEEIGEWVDAADADETRRIIDALVACKYIHEVEPSVFEIHGNESQIENRVKKASSSSKGGEATRIKWAKLQEAKAERPSSGTPKQGRVKAERPTDGNAETGPRLGTMQGNAGQGRAVQGNAGQSEDEHSTTSSCGSSHEGDLKCAAWLQKAILLHNPDAVRVRNAKLDDWADTFRLMRERDGLDEAAIRGVLTWLFEPEHPNFDPDPFWRVNIQSAAKFREKWDTLTARMNNPKQTRSGGGFR